MIKHLVFQVSILVLSGSLALAADSRIIYTDSNGEVKVGDREGASFTLVASSADGLSFSSQIAFDEDTGLAYVHNANTAEIVAVDINSLTPSVTTFATSADNTMGIAVDTENDFLYWTDEVFGIGPGSGRFIRRAPLSDGSQVTSMYASGNSNGPIGVAIDPVSDQLFWTDALDNAVYRVSLSSTDFDTDKVLVASGANGAFLVGVAVDSLGQNVLWVDQNTNSIYIRPMDGSGTSTEIIPNRTGLSELAVDAENRRVYFVEYVPDDPGTASLNYAGLDGTKVTQILSNTDAFGVAIDVETPPLGPGEIIDAPPVVVVQGDSVTIKMKQFTFDSDEEALLHELALEDPEILPLLPGQSSVQYQPTISTSDSNSSTDFRTKVSKRREVTFKNLKPNQWIASYQVLLGTKRSAGKIERLTDKFQAQLDKAVPGSKRAQVLQKVKLKFTAKFDLQFKTDESPSEDFEIQ